MKKVLFRVDGNAEIGWGHFYRCLSLAQMLKDNFLIAFAMAQPEDFARQLLLRAGITVIALNAKPYTRPDDRGTAEFEFDLKNQLKGVSILVIDGYWFKEKYLIAAHKHPAKLVTIEDDGHGAVHCHAVINHAAGPHASLYRPVHARTYFALGPRYALLRPEFLAEATTVKSPKQHLKTVVICLGGGDVRTNMKAITGWFLKHSDLILTVIGRSSLSSDLRALSAQYEGRLQLHSNLSAGDMVKVLNAADLGIFPASGILYEAFACRLPAMVGVTAKNQEKMYDGLKNLGAFVALGDFAKADFKSAMQKLDTGACKAMTEAQSKIIDGLSAFRFQDLFAGLSAKEMKRPLNFYSAKAADSAMLYEWAMDKTARMNSFNTASFTFAKHDTWLRQKLDDPKFQCLIFQTEQKQQIGMVRFDKQSTYTLMGINVAAEARGKGYAQQMIEMATSFVTKSQTLPIIAQIKKSNAASRKVFANAGFILEREVTINKQLSWQYRYENRGF